MQLKYEIIYILDPASTPEEVQAVSAKVEQIVTDAKGSVLKKDEWGKRRMAYTVGKHREGTYHYFHVLMDGSIVAEVTRNLRLFERVIKFMFVQDDFSHKKSIPRKVKLSTLHGASHPGAPGAPRPSSAPSAAPSSTPPATAPSAAPAVPAAAPAPAPASAPKPVPSTGSGPSAENPA
jgi:small subunit ribosomal protein S6